MNQAEIVFFFHLKNYVFFKINGKLISEHSKRIIKLKIQELVHIKNEKKHICFLFYLDFIFSVHLFSFLLQTKKIIFFIQNKKHMLFIFSY